MRKFEKRKKKLPKKASKERDGQKFVPWFSENFKRTNVRIRRPGVSKPKILAKNLTGRQIRTKILFKNFQKSIDRTKKSWYTIDRKKGKEKQNDYYRNYRNNRSRTWWIRSNDCWSNRSNQVLTQTP